MSVLETDRLVLRPLVETDAPDIQREFACWEVIQHLSKEVPWPYPSDGAHQFVRARLASLAAKPSDRCWAICLRRYGTLIGLIDYWAQSRDGGNRGFWLGVPWQGQGYMSEAIIAVQDELFFRMNVGRLVLCNAVNNPASRRVKEKTGARFVGYVSFPHRDGEDRAERWELTAEMWSAFRGRS